MAAKMDARRELSTCQVHGIILNACDKEAGETGRVSALQEFILQPKETDTNQVVSKMTSERGGDMERTHQGDVTWSDGTEGYFSQGGQGRHL